jgi:hypothetical protein
VIGDGGRWDRLRSWGCGWEWVRSGWKLRIDTALYALPLPAMYTAANGPIDEGGTRGGYSVTLGLVLGTRSLSDPVVALECVVPVRRYRAWVWLNWLLPNGMDGKRAFRGWEGERWPWSVQTESR